jgi:hypothetical protein
VKEKIKKAVFAVCIGVAGNAFLALFFACVSAISGRSFVSEFYRLFFICFGLFGGWTVVDAFLTIVSNLPDNCTTHYGIGFYYGVFGFYYVLIKLLGMEVNGVAFFLSCCFSGLLCYIYWLKHKSSES